MLGDIKRFSGSRPCKSASFADTTAMLRETEGERRSSVSRDSNSRSGRGFVTERRFRFTTTRR